MPTIQAAGWPTSAEDRVRVRSSGATHSAAASVPAVVSTATATPTGSWARASSGKVGAAALAIEATASSADAASSCRPRPTRPATVPSSSAVIACGQAGDRPQLTGGGRRHVQVAGRLRQDRRHRDHRRLAREQAQEESGAHRYPPLVSPVVSVAASGLVVASGDRRPVNGSVAAEAGPR